MAELTFFSLGDWGNPGNDLTLVSQQLAVFADLWHPSFFTLLGDNFYESGVRSVDDPLWQTTYQDTFTSASVQVPFYAILGNHDYRGNDSAEIDYFKQGKDNRWHLEDRNYTKIFSVDESTTLQIVFIDTMILAPLATSTLILQAEEEGSLTTAHATKLLQDQVDNDWPSTKESMYQWLDDTLASSTATWLFVAGHYPVFSDGEHGDTRELVDTLQPMLVKYGVDAYLCGHDHTLQHLQDPLNGIEYFVSGNGAKRGSLAGRAGTDVMFSVVDPGFMIHTVSGNRFETKMIDEVGEEIYNYIVYK